MWPSPPDMGRAPLLQRLLTWAHDAGLPRAFDVAALELTANIAMFVPLGLLLASSARVRTPWLAVAAGLAFSATIETVQIVLPGRFPTVQDVVANTLGAGLGAAAIAALGALRRRRARRAALPGTPAPAPAETRVTPSSD